MTADKSFVGHLQHYRSCLHLQKPHGIPASVSLVWILYKVIGSHKVYKAIKGRRYTQFLFFFFVQKNESTVFLDGPFSELRRAICMIRKLRIPSFFDVSIDFRFGGHAATQNLLFTSPKALKMVHLS